MARVLTIEDDEATRRLLSLHMSGAGHTVLEAEDGDRGLEAARAQRPDLVLLDLGLPGTHGTRVLDALKDDPATRDIPVIVVSAWGEGHVITVSLEKGAVGVLRKPFSATDLHALVARALAT